MDKALMARATSSDDAPTPGYMYGEISKMSLVSFETCKEIEDYLLARLKKNNHNVKYKCLIIMKHVCRTGRPDFKRDIARQTELVRECLQYRGPPDPLRGDQIYKRVHEAAKEALDAIYDSEAPSSVGPSSVSSRIQGFGSDPNPIQGPQPATASGSLSSITDIASSVVGAVTSKFGVPSASGGMLGAGRGGGPGYGGPGAMPYGPPSTAAVGVSGSPRSGWTGGGGGGGAASSNSRYGGLGNPNFSDPRNEKTFLEKASTLVKAQIGSVVNTVNTAASGVSPQKVTYAQPPDYNYATNRGPTANQWKPSSTPYDGALPPASSTTTQAMPPPPPSSAGESTSAYHQARNQQAFQWSQQAPGTRASGGVGGVWGSSGVNRPPPQPQGSTSESMPSANGGSSSTTTTSNTGVNGVGQGGGQVRLQQAGRVGGAASDGEYEKRLVLELCAPGGTRAVPPKEKLDEFLSSTRTLSIDVVGGIVLDQLAEESWQVRSKALSVVEGLIRQTGVEEWKHFFIDNAGELEAVASDGKAVVRDKAVKILHSLGIQFQPSSSASQTAPQQQLEAGSPTVSSPGGARDLLDMGGDDDGVICTPGGGVGTPQRQQVPVDLLNGGTNLVGVQSSSPHRVVEHRTDLFTGGDYHAPPPQQPTPSRAAPVDLFADVAVKPPPPAQQQQLASPGVVPPPRQEEAPPASLFADLSLSGSQKAATSGDDLISIANDPVVRNVSPMNAFDPLAGRKGGPSAAPPVQQPPASMPTVNPDLASLGSMPFGGGRPPAMGGPGAGQGRVVGGPPFVPHHHHHHHHLVAGVPPTNLGKMGQGMIPALQPRTIIPSAEEPSSSAFAFIGGQQGGPSSSFTSGPGPAGKGNPPGNEDAFSFVKDAMRTS